VKKGIDPFQLLNSDCYFSDYGVAVAPEYYGLGLGFHLFSCILPMSKAFDIPGAFTIFTSNFSQAIAEKLGFELCREVPYEEYKDENGSRVFPEEGTCKCMILKLQHRELGTPEK